MTAIGVPYRYSTDRIPGTAAVVQVKYESLPLVRDLVEIWSEWLRSVLDLLGLVQGQG